MSAHPTPRRVRWRTLAHFATHAPPWVSVVIGAGAVLLGLLVVTRPLTSLVLLAIYVALSAIATGVAEVVRPREPRWLSRVLAIVWVALGLGILLGLRGALQILPAAIAVLLFVGGLTSLADAVMRGRASERVLSATWGASQIVFDRKSRTKLSAGFGHILKYKQEVQTTLNQHLSLVQVLSDQLENFRNRQSLIK